MKRLCAVAALLAVAGCRGDRGYAVAINIEPGCATGATRLRVVVTIQPAGETRTVEISTPPLFESGRRRVVIIPPDSAQRIRVAVVASDEKQALGRAEIEFEVAGSRSEERSLQIAACGESDGASGGDGGDLGPPDAGRDAQPDLASDLASPLDSGGEFALLDGPSADATVDLAVTPDLAVTITQIALTPATPQIPKGTSLPLKATATYSDGTVKDVTLQATWSTDKPLVATVGDGMSGKGLLSAIGMGVATITAKLDGVAGSTPVFVTSATLLSIGLSPTNPTVAKGSSPQFIATGIYSDGSSQDISSTVTWASSSELVATVSNLPGKRGLASALAEGSAAISATQEGIKGSTTLTVSGATLVSLAVTPTTPTIAKGTTIQFQTTGTFSDKSTQDLTIVAAWSSSDAAVAKVDATGIASGEKAGVTTITATLNGISDQTGLTVSSANLLSIAITAPEPQMAKGTRQQLVAVGTYSDNTTQDLTTLVTWAVADDKLISVSNAGGSQGLASGLTVGTTTVTAALGNVSGKLSISVSSATLVSIELAPVESTIAKGTKLQFVATGLFSDMSTQDLTQSATWSSSAPGVATVSSAMGSRGLATGVDVGKTTITAAAGNLTGTTSLIVTNAALTDLVVSPPDPKLAKGTKLQLTATGTYSDNSTQDLTTAVSWSSSSMAAAVSNAMGSQGLASGLAQGSAVISATLGMKSGTVTVTVTAATLVSIGLSPAGPTIAKGTKQQFTATGVFSDNSTQDLTGSAAWLSANPVVATVSSAMGSAGLATGVALGMTTITASVGNLSGMTSITVSNAALTDILVTPSNPKVAKGSKVQLTATGVYSDNSTQDVTTAVTWATSNMNVSVSNAMGSQGLATAVTQGLSVVSATLGMKSGSVTFTITSATLAKIDLAPLAPSIAKGTTKQFTATGTYSDNSQQDVTASATWASSNMMIATLNPGVPGLATGVSKGAATVSAKVGNITGVTTLTVTDAILVSIAVAPNGGAVLKGGGRGLRLVATGTYSDNSTQNVSATATWESSNTNQATVSNANGSQGVVTGIADGSVTISAKLGAVVGKATVKVATATKFTVTPASVMIKVGATQQYTALATFTDNSTYDVTAQVYWTSSANRNATISAAGLATGVMAGKVTIFASAAFISAMAALEVVP